MTTEAGKRLLALDDYGWACVDGVEAAEYVAAIETEAIEGERKRIISAIRVDRYAHPVFAYVDSYSLGQVLKGNPWPKDE